MMADPVLINPSWSALCHRAWPGDAKEFEAVPDLQGFLWLFRPMGGWAPRRILAG